MITNLHTHTARCRHARGAEREYVEAAIAAGIQKLGFSDHTPYWFPGDYYSRFRMFPDQLEDYVSSVLACRNEYAGRIDIRLGLEAEFYPSFFPELMARLKDTPMEYLLLGQHYIGNEIGDQYSGWATEDVDHLRRYCNQVADAMYTGLFTYLAHPDLIHFVGDTQVYRDHVRTICRASKDSGVPLEWNFLGMRAGRHYPNMEFWHVAAEEGCDVVFGCDAHGPEEMNPDPWQQQAKEIVQQLGMHLIEDPVIRKI